MKANYVSSCWHPEKDTVQVINARRPTDCLSKASILELSDITIVLATLGHETYLLTDDYNGGEGFQCAARARRQANRLSLQKPQFYNLSVYLLGLS